MAGMSVASVDRHASVSPPTEAASKRRLTDAEGLAIELLNRVRGEVRFDSGSRALYSTDSSNYRQVPIGVVIPRDADDVIATIATCREFGAPIVSRGGGTSLAGQTCNVAVVMDHSKYFNQLLELNPDQRWARVQPGIVLDTLRDSAEKHHLTFGPDPATHNHCTLGGMIGNNSCGVHSVMAGKTDDNVLELDVLTYEGLRLTVGPTSESELDEIIAAGDRRGQIYAAMRDIATRHADEIRARFPDIPRRVSGYNLPWLLPENGFNVARALVGSELTLVTVLEAKLRLVDSPPARSVVVLGFEDVFAAADAVPEVMASGPIACEGFDRKLVQDSEQRHLAPWADRILPKGDGWLIVEFGGRDRSQADANAQTLIDRFDGRPDGPTSKLFDRADEEAHIWKIRESGLGATAMVPSKPLTFPGWEDSSVPPERLGEYLRSLDRLFDDFGYDADLYGHFGQGVLHCRIDFGLLTKPGIDDFRRFMDQAADLVISMGGSLSGEHGDGQARAELLPKMYGAELVEAFNDLKRAWDPAAAMNPGKVVRPNSITSDLRLGPETFDPPQVGTHFGFADDNGSFAHAAMRCVGVGECRKGGEGTMCPSYMATHEEKHSTRGRARMLFEMMQGDVVTDGWRSDEVKEALDLCLSCKACKSECPVNVDMATYKAEFLSHYWAGRLRPRQAYIFGLLPWWLRIGARMPRLANLATQAPGLRSVAKLVAGIAPERRIPALAEETFSDWFRRRSPDERSLPHAGEEPRRVILWPDTFTDHFHPDSARSAVEVLEAAGWQVELPDGWVCCGRPLYDFGFIGQARALLRRAMRTLRPALRAGVPIVGLEPSCVAAFRDELVELNPELPEAKRLHDSTYLLSEFLAKVATDYQPPQIAGKAVVHGHCQQKAVLDMDAEVNVLRATGLDVEVLDSGCCGMAGNFGFERGEKYAVSVAAGERVLLPAVRQAPADTYVVATGFSCREQIAQLTDRRAMHPADLLAAGLRAADTPDSQPTANRKEV